jgi:hypothetical protein
MVIIAASVTCPLSTLMSTVDSSTEYNPNTTPCGACVVCVSECECGRGTKQRYAI